MRQLFSPAQAYDQHLNMVLSDVEEVITTMELDEETFEEIYKVSESKSTSPPHTPSFFASPPVPHPFPSPPHADHQAKCSDVIRQRRWCDSHFTSTAPRDVATPPSSLSLHLLHSCPPNSCTYYDFWVKFLSVHKYVCVCAKS